MLKRDDFDDLGHTFTLTPVAGTTSFEVSMHVPPKAEVEQAIARLRPIVLNDDPIFWAKVLKAVSARANDGDRVKEAVKPLRDAWKIFPPKYMTFMATNTETGESYTGDDSEIVMDWLYSELLHAMVEPAKRIAMVTDEVKWQTATNFARDGITITLNTAKAIRRWADEGLIDFSEESA
jgi:hypothetical protein